MFLMAPPRTHGSWLARTLRPPALPLKLTWQEPLDLDHAAALECLPLRLVAVDLRDRRVEENGDRGEIALRDRDDLRALAVEPPARKPDHDFAVTLAHELLRPCSLGGTREAAALVVREHYVVAARVGVLLAAVVRGSDPPFIRLQCLG